MCFMERAISTTAAVEEWRPVVGYEGLYEVSNIGRVRSVSRWIHYISKYGKPYKIWMEGRILTLKISNGYCLAHLSHHGIAKHKTIHRIVAEAFIQNPDNLPEVNHKDENPKNNCVENLEWCTTVYNIRYGTAIERRSSCIRKPIAKYTKSGEFVASYISATEASKLLGKGRKGTGLISTAARGLKPSAYGYRWRYVDN